ncbi:MAG TPA: hypothetical protein VM222_03235 [Planctomycetota bacterium]|nr:hypothetical protein [Planctomycetota bacterium]
MSGIVRADRVHVLRRLRDLREWARFVHESVREDQPFESGKRDLLAAYMGEEFLRRFTEDSGGLADRLDLMIRALESSAKPAEQAANNSR